MVDALPRALRESGFAAERGRDPVPVRVEPFATVAERYSAFCKDAIFGPHQSPEWLQAWGQETGAEMHALTVGAADDPQLMLVVEIAQGRMFRTARFPGGAHANGNFPATAPKAVSALAPPAFDALGASLGNVDLVALERLEPLKDGLGNPLLALATGDSPNVALATDLSGGFDALLERRSGKRKRKKHRSQIRKFEAAGGYRFIRARTPAEAEALLDAFFAMRDARFRQLGARNTFGDPKVQSFIRHLYVAELSRAAPRFVLDGLEIGGTLRAVTGCSVMRGRMACDFTAMDESGLASSSPGEFLFFELIRKACENGLAVFDFSVGDEPYKRLWCDIETRQRDLFLPLTGRGRAIAYARRSMASAKRSIKDSPLVWSLAKRLRRVARTREVGDD